MHVSLRTTTQAAYEGKKHRLGGLERDKNVQPVVGFHKWALAYLLSAARLAP